ncbi:MAG: integrase catalytic subunit [Gallionellaceae bacterium]|nr:MAG: integrase catalytic subunit [Gallionellaceae bacterium]
MLGVSECGFRAWRNRVPPSRSQENARLEVEIRAAHRRTRESRSAERPQSDLADHGVQASPYRVRKLRKKLGLRCKRKRKFKVTTDPGHKLPVAPNLLNREFAVTAPNKAWVSDITYIPADEGWLYLAGVKDSFNGEPVGHATSERMNLPPVMRAPFRAASTKRPPPGLILHSDRGSQYCARDYQKPLCQFGMKASMGRKGDCRECEACPLGCNAPMESFRGTPKNELVHHRKFGTRHQAKREISGYIGVFYNRQRKQKRLGYLSPAKFTQRYYATLLAA